jgi:hypothetical protein
MLPAANASNSVVFATQRLAITDFIGPGGILTLACVVIGSPVIYYMVRFPFPFPRACSIPHTTTRTHHSLIIPLAGSALEFEGSRQNPVKIRRRSGTFFKNRQG